MTRLTPEEVRKLPLGTEIQLHGYDRYGIHYAIEGVIVQSGKSKVFKYTDIDSLSTTKRITVYKNKWWTTKE